MTSEELGRLYPITLEPYNDTWPALFEKEKEHLKSLLGESLKVEHIGSTAVKGISAKPTIDIVLEYPGGFTEAKIIKKMEENSYIYMKEQTRHLMFVKGYTPNGLANESYHIHIGPVSDGWLWDRIYFRDYLMKHAQEARIYERLKIELAAIYQYDRDAYTDGKSKYIETITERAKKWKGL